MSTVFVPNQKHLHAALQQIDLLLEDVDEKIDKERNLLFRIQEKDCREDKNESATCTTADIYDSNLLESSLERQLNASLGPSVLDILLGTVATETTSKLIETIKSTNSLTTNSGQTFRETLITNVISKSEAHIISSSGNVIIPSKKFTMLETMIKYRCGYLSASIQGVLESVIYTPYQDLQTNFNTLCDTALRMLDEKKIQSFGELLNIRLKKEWNWLKQLNSSVVQSYSKKFLTSLTENRLDDDIKDIITSYDNFFTEEEGNRLLDSVVQWSGYSVNAGTANASAIYEELLTAAIAPANRKAHSFEQNLWVNKVNKAYTKRYTLQRAVVDKHNSNNTEYDTGTEWRRRLGKRNYRIKSEYVKLIRHLILKHPKLFKQFFKHYKLSERRKYRPFYRKKYHKSHDRNHKHSKRRHDKEKRKRTSKTNKNKISENITNVNSNATNYRAYYTKPFQAYFKDKTRFKIISVSPRRPALS